MDRKRFSAVLVFVSIFSFSFGPVANAAGYYRLLPDSKYFDALGPNVVGNAFRAGRAVRGLSDIDVPAVTNTAPFMESSYSDVPSDHPSLEAIEYVSYYGLMQGQRGGTFDPSGSVTRGEFTTSVADRMFSYDFIEDCFANISFPYGTEYDLIFKDVPKEGEEARHICAALMSGVIHGYPDETFKKDQSIVFAEAAKILTRTYDVSFLPHRGYGNEWFQLYVSYLAERAGIPLSIGKFDQAITRAEAAELLFRMDADVTSKPSRSYRELAVAAGLKIAGSMLRWAL
jgi:hypothetical protein